MKALYPADKYTYRVLWSDDDQAYVGRCSEFPALGIAAKTHDEALKGIISKVENTLATMRQAKMDPPIPLSVSMLRDRK
jgi:hypothetical protein